MKRQIRSYEAGGTNATGTLVGLNLKVREPAVGNAKPNKDHLLELQLPAIGLDMMVSRLLDLGLKAAARHNLPATPADGVENFEPLPSTLAFASMLDNDRVNVCLRFGMAQVNATLTHQQARALATELVQSSATPPAPTAVQ